MKHMRLLILTTVFFILSCEDSSVSSDDYFSPVPIDNFRLLDHSGKSHELFYYDDASAIVIMVHGNGCPIVRNALPDFSALKSGFDNKNIRFFLLNSNLQDTRQSIAKEAEEWGITIPILVDESQLIGESLDLTRTAEILIIDPKTASIIYRGPLSNRVGYEVQKEQATQEYAADALQALLAGKKVLAADQATKGCLINFPHKDISTNEPISYVNDVAPILLNRCIRCHRDDGVAPWSMSSYDMVRGFGPMIREVVRLNRMPPWGADPHVGSWSNDFGLTVDEKKTLVHWIESGAIKDDGVDPLTVYEPPKNEWELGEPDLIIDVPPFKVPATGLVEYQYPSLKNPLNKDVWVRAVSIKPGDPKAIHHMYAGVSLETLGGYIPQKHSRLMEGYLMLWTPGNNYAELPSETAIHLPKDAIINFEIHYTPYGKASTDNTQMALYFTDEPPKNILRYSEVRNEFLLIPSFDGDYLAQSYHWFDRDATLHMLLPHSHYRGETAKYLLEYPNGEMKELLSVPKYNFNWQLGYHFEEPLAVPAGSRLIYQAAYDNSIYNPNNPDPSRDVPWGYQSADEMLFGPFTFTWDDETVDNIFYNSQKMYYTRLMGAMDKNMDGELARTEINKGYRRTFYPLFFRGDKNQDDKLSYTELMSAIK